MNDFTITHNADGTLTYTGKLTAVQVATLLHVNEELDPQIFEDVERETVSKRQGAVYSDALKFAESCYADGEDVPTPLGNDKEERMVSWYLSHAEYPGTAKDRRIAKDAERAALEAEQAKLEA